MKSVKPHAQTHRHAAQSYLNLLRSSVDPVQQSAGGVKGQSLHVLQIFPHYNLLTRAAVQTQALQEGGQRQVRLGENTADERDEDTEKILCSIAAFWLFTVILSAPL